MAGLGDHQVGILLGELLELRVTRQSSLDGRKFFGGNIPSVVLATLPVLKLVIRPSGARTLFKGVGGEFAALHGDDGGDLVQKLWFGGMAHIVTITLDTINQKTSPIRFYAEFGLTPNSKQH